MKKVGGGENTERGGSLPKIQLGFLSVCIVTIALNHFYRCVCMLAFGLLFVPVHARVT